MVRPEVDQIPASCKNWFSVQRWVDISNDQFGVTWSPVDAPLVQVGGITANLIGSQTNPDVWIQHLRAVADHLLLGDEQPLAHQLPRRAGRPDRVPLRHPSARSFAAEEAARFGVACSQPLIVTRPPARLRQTARLRLSSDKVLVTAFKPSDDGKGWIVRLFGASGRDQTVKLAWAEPAPTRCGSATPANARRPLRAIQ